MVAIFVHFDPTIFLHHHHYSFVQPVNFLGVYVIRTGGAAFCAKAPPAAKET
jgi:hypothetical protein